MGVRGPRGRALASRGRGTGVPALPGPMVVAGEGVIHQVILPSPCVVRIGVHRATSLDPVAYAGRPSLPRAVTGLAEDTASLAPRLIAEAHLRALRVTQ